MAIDPLLSLGRIGYTCCISLDRGMRSRLGLPLAFAPRLTGRVAVIVGLAFALDVRPACVKLQEIRVTVLPGLDFAQLTAGNQLSDGRVDAFAANGELGRCHHQFLAGKHPVGEFIGAVTAASDV